MKILLFRISEFQTKTIFPPRASLPFEAIARTVLSPSLHSLITDCISNFCDEIEFELTKVLFQIW